MKKAFTLSEVLITLSIIGVIAALTIPTVVKNYRYKMYATQIQKTYSQIQTAIKTVMEDEMTNNFYETTAGARDDNTNCTKGSCYFSNKYFKLARQNCSTGTKKCIANSYISTSGANAGFLAKNTWYCGQTVNGAAICIVNNPKSNVTSLFIDTNGTEAPNTTGLDAFAMNFTSDGQLKDWSTDPDKCNTKSSSYGHIADYATGCLTKVINNGWVIKD